ncbi:MAG: DUF4468 domain-containing protein [Pedobacter sp.]|nr:MAG: DUF4468 domain-containing protein [Pedobacter sp.]
MLSGACVAQDKPLSLDERGKLIYYEVVEVKTTPKDSLFSRAAAFVNRENKKLKLISASADTALEASGKMMISKNALGMSRPSGEVSYNFYAQIKQGKYRFWLTDFVFVPYMRDRYGNFVPSTPKGNSLDSDPGKLSAGDWASYKKMTARESKVLADQFKEALATSISKDSPAAKPKNTISTKEW